MYPRLYALLFCFTIITEISLESVDTGKYIEFEKIRKTVSVLQDKIRDMRISARIQRSEDSVKIQELVNSVTEQNLEIEKQKVNITNLEKVIMTKDLQKCKFEQKIIKLERNFRLRFEDQIHKLFSKYEQTSNTMENFNKTIQNLVQEFDDRLDSIETSLKYNLSQIVTQKRKRNPDVLFPPPPPEVQKMEERLNNVTQENTELKKELEKLREKIEYQAETETKGNFGGAMYVRWGRTTCSGEQTELIYAGQTGGSHYDHPGGAANHLCLPNNPTWDKYRSGSSHHAFIYGSKIATDGQNIPGSTVDRKYHGQDLPCAVCRSRNRTSSLMIPGRNVCEQGWNLEYRGYLMAGRHSHQTATEYTCMDGELETLPGKMKYTWRNIFYSVEAQCDPLRCPPYVNGREMTCAVCTK